MNELRLLVFASIVAILTSACGGGGSGSGSGNDDVTTPVEPSSPTMSKEILISELMVNPSTLANSLGQWFEVHNPGASELNLRDCVFSNTAIIGFNINFDMIIDAGEYLTFAISAIPGFVPDFNYNVSGLTLIIPADILTLTCNGIVIDSRNYTFTSSGRSSALSNNGNAKWCDDRVNPYNGDTGTPGSANIDIVCP
jgi:hypothetical protein